LKCDGTRAETRFRLSAKRTSQFKSAGGVSSVDYWQPSCAHQPAGFVLPEQACVLQLRDAYWLHNPFSCLPSLFLPCVTVCHHISTELCIRFIGECIVEFFAESKIVSLLLFFITFQNIKDF
jgi:hypothetical protein